MPAPAPRISVIVPVYNDWHRIPRLLGCLAAQTLPTEQFEILLIDNGSDSFDPPQNLAPNARILNCETPGSYAARNHGIEQARGHWLAFTDADCLPAPDWLQQLLAQAPATADNSAPTTILAGQVRMIASSAHPSAWEMHDLVKGIPQGWYVSRGYAATANLLVPADLARLGVTTLEAKSGYGLNTAAELKQLEVYRQLNQTQPLEIIPTFLGAHLVPVEYRERRADYINLLCEEMIPAVAEQQLARFCDVFIENSAFTLGEGRRILECAKRHGLGLKIHADQLSSGGGAGLAAELGAVSAEHLEYASQADIAAMAQAGTVAVSLPLASMYLKEPFLPARRWIEAGARVAVATDFNPGSAPSYHLHLAMTLACVHQQMTPAEVLRGVTNHAARAIDLHHDRGSLLPGYQADFAVIDAPDINHWLYHFRPNACRMTVKSGQIIWRS